MNLVWVNEDPSKRRDRFSGAPLIRHVRQAHLHSPAHRSSKIRRCERSVIGLNFSVPKDDEDPINQTEDGKTFFLITRQKDFPKTSRTRPTQCIDSLCSPIIVLDGNERLIIDWISSSWLPATDHAQPGKFFGCFSLVWPGDGKYSAEFLRPAFQASSDRSFFTLMAVSTRRMSLDRSTSIYGTKAPAYFTLKAIQALRKSITDKDFLTDQLLLDLTLLLLAELYSKSPDSIAGLEVYWSMIRDYITSLGGLYRIRPIIVSFIMSIDALVSLLTASLPKINVWRDPLLLGMSAKDLHTSGNHAHQARSDDGIISAIAQLEIRSQILIEVLDVLTQLFSAIDDLPGPSQDCLRIYLRQNMRSAVFTCCTPLCSHIPSVSSMSGDESLYVQADMAHNFTRMYGIVLWWYYTAVNFVPKDSTLATAVPVVVALATSQAWRLADRIREIVGSEPWYVASDMVFWLASMGCLVVKESCDWAEYWRLLKDTAKEKNIDSEVEIEKVLRPFLSLSILDASYVKTLRFLLNDDRSPRVWA